MCEVCKIQFSFIIHSHDCSVRYKEDARTRGREGAARAEALVRTEPCLRTQGRHQSFARIFDLGHVVFFAFFEKPYPSIARDHTRSRLVLYNATTYVLPCLGRTDFNSTDQHKISFTEPKRFGPRTSIPHGWRYSKGQGMQHECAKGPS